MRLGVWQLHRASEKLALQQQFEQKRQQGPVAVESLSLGGLKTDAVQLQNMHVQLQGTYLNNRTLLMVYQPYEGELGYEVVTPFKLDSSDQLVLVSRGWILAEPLEALIKRLPPIEGTQKLLGQIYVPTEKMANKANHLKSIQWPLVIRYLNTLELAPNFDKPLFPYVVRLDEGQRGVLIRHWPEVVVDVGRNQSYALQWFAMAIAVAVVSLILSSNILDVIREKYKRL